MLRAPSALCFFATLAFSSVASATASGELYTGAAYGYGRVEARIKFAAGDGVVSSFFLWKDGSEQPNTFWNELDYEKIGADCGVETNAIFGKPSSNHNAKLPLAASACAGYHVYAYEWTPDAIVWLVDGVEARRETGATAAAFADNVPAGMQIHFNVWPGDASFGGNFDPSILPVHEYVDWVQYSTYANGAFTLAWREDFAASTLPTGWGTGTWGSPKNLSTHDPLNVNFVNGFAVISLTADDAKGATGADPGDPGQPGGAGGTATGGASGTSGAGGMAAAGSGGASSGAGGMAAGSAGAPSATGGAGNGGDTGGTAVPPADNSKEDGGCALAVPRPRATALLAAVGFVALVLLRRRSSRFR